MSSVVIIGVDPGVTGAIALLHDRGAYVHDFSDYEKSSEVVRGWIEKDRWTVKKFTIENFGSRPGKGHFGSFKLAKNLGFWIGFAVGMGMNVDLVRPQDWQRRVIGPIQGKDTKERSLKCARELMPYMHEFLKRKKDHNRADALNIAYYGKLMYQAEMRILR